MGSRAPLRLTLVPLGRDPFLAGTCNGSRTKPLRGNRRRIGEHPGSPVCSGSSLAVKWGAATALVALTVDIHRFPSGRDFASYLGLTPREHSSGSKRHLGAISKRGDVYLRMLLVHGARATLWHAQHLKERDRLRAWALRLEKTAGHNKATVALANKLARIVWASWKYDRRFEPMAAQAA